MPEAGPASDYKPPYMRWFEGDFWADRAVIRMTWLQRHFYRALLLASFRCDTRPYLPDDDAQLWVLADAKSAKAWKENREAVLVKFTPLTDDKGRPVLSNKRVLEEWQVASAKSQIARQKGILGRKKQLAGNSESRATAQPQPGISPALAQQNQSQNQITKSKAQKPSSSPDGDGVRLGFDVFWKAYPRRTARGAALKAWLKLKPDADLQQKILTAIEAQKKTDQWSKDGGRFIPHPATWLNHTRWLDEQPILSDGGNADERNNRYANRDRIICET